MNPTAELRVEASPERATSRRALGIKHTPDSIAKVRDLSPQGHRPCNLAPGKKECTPIDADPYNTRTLKPLLARAVAQFWAVLPTGPRKSGSTTFLRCAFAGTLEYASLEAADVRASVTEDPAAFSV